MLHDFKPADDGLDKAQRKAEIRRLRERLAAQQQSVMAAKLPVVVLVEGWDCAGKGHLINELISEMDPRFYRVAVYKRVPENEERYPFLRKFFEPLPENGKFLFMDTGWMEDCVYKYLRREITAEEYERRVDACNIFERQLRDNGYIVVKLFLHISREEQLSRIAELRENIDTEWRVTGDDLWQHKEYKAFRRAYGEFMEKTSVCGEWHVLDAGNRKKRLLAGFRAITEAIDNGLENGRCIGKAGKNDFPLLGTPSLRDADLTKSVAPEEYKAELKRLQEKLAALHNKIYRKRIPVVICYEGWDAAGKGGNIRRVVGLDIRLSRVGRRLQRNSLRSLHDFAPQSLIRIHPVAGRIGLFVLQIADNIVIIFGLRNRHESFQNQQIFASGLEAIGRPFSPRAAFGQFHRPAYIADGKLRPVDPAA